MNSTFVPHENPKLAHIQFQSDRIKAKVFPALGASLQEFTIDGLTIIEGIAIDESGLKQYAEGYCSSILFPFPNRLKNGSFTFNKENILLELNEPENQNAIHGLVYDKAFEIITLDSHSCILQYINDNSLYSYPYKLLIVYKFSNDSLKMTFEVQNTGNQTLPFGIGWHPYFNVNSLDYSTIKFDADSKVLVDDRMLPSEIKKEDISGLNLQNIELDDAFKLVSRSITLESPEYTLNMLVPDDSYLQLYTPPSRNSIAIEPMSCIANAFNTKEGLKNLAPRESYVWEVNLNITIYRK